MSGAVGSKPTLMVSGVPRASFAFRSLRSMKSTVPLPRKSSCSSRVMGPDCKRETFRAAASLLSETRSAMNQLIVLSAIVLLPLIPAFILFHTLKSSAQVDGPLGGGLKVSLGGAFGGYVALTVFIATYFAHMPHVTTWRVTGELQFPGGTPSVVTCEVHPPEFTIDGEN